MAKRREKGHYAAVHVSVHRAALVNYDVSESDHGSILVELLLDAATCVVPVADSETTEALPPF
ncbi:MAG: hypothetical protein OWQ51_10380 [Pyrobaculum arsenaticum]|uniref:Uncharacterized protein n=1 Tax=Pyrobaculum arsenaticum TaxID=121277 RepID=A0A7L4PC33_9CREN|nr:hypothetical protein [Pyrobaculum arsenaticum]MCY0891359.1 hypothetical protein [Pyrobaculum arsenaticum]NYR15426.1 hypothetical protein [Pyrobaculum arsenaticum]